MDIGSSWNGGGDGGLLGEAELEALVDNNYGDVRSESHVCDLCFVLDQRYNACTVAENLNYKLNKIGREITIHLLPCDNICC